MSFENGELDFKPLKPEFKSGPGFNEEHNKPVDPILEDELEEAAKQRADALLEQAELEKALAAAEQRETMPTTEPRKAAKSDEPRETPPAAKPREAVALNRKKKSQDELFDDRKDYLGPQRYDLAAWKNYYKKKKKIV